MAELTINYHIDLANSFIQDVKDTRNSYYVFAGKATPWTNEASPPAANGSVEQIGLTVYADMLFGKLLANSDVYTLIPRYDWTTNTAYTAYDQYDGDLYSKQFYVMNDQYQVYKCISNNRGAKSTVEPRLTTSYSTFNTADGYVWKYMYTVDPQANTKFTTTTYIPVATDNNVSGNAVSGSIDAYIITDGGNNYSIYESGFLYKFINKTTLQLPSTSSSNNNHYARSSIYLKSGFGAGQVREISSYNGANKQIRVATADAFDVYSRLDFTAVPSGTVAVGYYAEQKYDVIQYLYISNNQAFTTGSTVVQSDTATHGTILSANASALRIQKENPAALFENTLPIRDVSQSGTLKPGTVSVTAGANTVTGVSTQFADTANGYTVGSYIRVGSNANNQIRRVTQVISNTSLRVVSTFANTLVANVHYFVPIAAEPFSITANQGGSGIVSDINLNSLKLTISNSTLAGVSFKIGEQVTQVTSANTAAGANAIVAFANSSTVYLSAVGGPWIAGLFALGSSTLQKSEIVSIDSNPNLTISDPTGEFVLGFPMNFKLNAAAAGYTGNAIIIAVTTLPNDQTEYQIAPTVEISGDGTDAKAIAIVNNAFGSVNDIVGVEVIAPGQGYTHANVTIYSNTSFGLGASANAVIAPVGGHGKDAVSELGSRYVGVTSTFDTGINEGFFYPTYGSFRKIGIIENPEFADVRVTLQSFDRVNLVINNKATTSPPAGVTTWYPGEVVVQPSTKAAGVVVSGNNTTLQVKSVLGEFGASNAQIISYYSNTTANVSSQEIIRFQVTSDSLAEILSQVGSGASGEVTQLLTNTSIVLSNVVGKFVTGDTIYDSSVNAYAVVNSISTANGSRDVTSSFGNKFNQTMRLTITANTGAYTNGEAVVQDISNATAVVVSGVDELDLQMTITTGSFSTGQKIIDTTTGAYGFTTFANNTYLKLTGVTQSASFVAGHTINNGLGSTATIGSVVPVLLLNHVDGPNRFQAGSDSIVGQTSGATGTCNAYALIQYPELIRDTGKVIYIDNVQPVTRSETSKEEVRLVIKF